MQGMLEVEHRPGSLIAALLTAALVVGPTLAAPPADVEAELEQLGVTLKAAVISETMTEDEAVKVYFTMAERLGADRDDKGADDAEGPKRDVMLNAPRPEQIRMLFLPEFLRRDLTLLRDHLEFDRDQMLIAEVLFDEYREAYDLASAPLREALSRYQRTSTDEWLVSALERAGVTDAADAEARIRRAVETWTAPKEGEDEAAAAKRREQVDAWTEKMVVATRTMTERLASFRDRLNSELADLNRDGVELTAEDVLRRARRLRADRAQLRTDMTASLAVIATDEQRGEADLILDTALARIAFERQLPRGRMNGEGMDLWAALREAGAPPIPPDMLASAEAMLDGQALALADVLDQRTNATIDRELAGLAFQAARDRLVAANGGTIFDVDERRLGTATAPFADAVRRELTASIAVRDALLALLEESEQAVVAVAPESAAAARYRTAALRRGFPTEMRPRWSERAIAAALEFDDLEPHVPDALVTLEEETRGELVDLREAAVAKRTRRDPELAREQIDARFADADDVKAAFGAELWLGMNFEAFDAVDDRVEGWLRGVLTPAQFERLPDRGDRSGKKDSGKTSSGKGGAGKGAGRGKGAGAGKGAGSGKRPGGDR